MPLEPGDQSSVTRNHGERRRACIRTHAHARMHTRTHAHARTHIHKLSQSQQEDGVTPALTFQSSDFGGTHSHLRHFCCLFTLLLLCHISLKVWCGPSFVSVSSSSLSPSPPLGEVHVFSDSGCKSDLGKTQTFCCPCLFLQAPQSSC